MASHGKISRNLAVLSRVMAWLSTAGFLIIPVVAVYIFLWPEHPQGLTLDMDHLGAELNATIPLQYRMMALACALVPVGFTMWALWSLRRLFLLYAGGEVFSAGALSALNHVAFALFGGVVAGFVMQAPMSLALSWPNGHRAISLGFGSGDVSTLFMAGVVLVIARVMAEAHRMADENAKFV
jgi:hypothetical protein